jgi:hypothetical protein
MQTIEATYRNGVFAPKCPLTIPEGTRVVLHVDLELSSGPFLPDALLLFDDPSDLPELPMPPNGQSVVATAGELLLPDPLLI